MCCVARGGPIGESPRDCMPHERDTTVSDVDRFKVQGKHYSPEESLIKKYDVNELTIRKIQRVNFVSSLSTSASIV